MEHNSIPELVEDIQAGRMIVMIDDEERENEGDLVMAASKVRPEDINFMARYFYLHATDQGALLTTG